ncbi:EF-hand domain-containing protein [Streptomyces atriruber]|uniref:EF-hand domain-containing protein n=1 Tax=Streptomyces atriruber TaxID=545121 RepID=A0ABV3BED7_9ACTN
MYETMHGFWESVVAPADGAISRTEFTHIFGSTGRAADDERAEVFNALDLDASGALSRVEYRKAVSEFFHGDGPGSPANHIFGPLTQGNWAGSHTHIET